MSSCLICTFRVDEASSLFLGQIYDDGRRKFDDDAEFCECDYLGVIRCSPLPALNNEIKG